MVFLLKYRRLNQQPTGFHGPSDYNPREVFDRFTAEVAHLRKYICIENMMKEWFYRKEVTRRDVADLLTYGFWFRSREQLTAEGQGHLPDLLVDEIESAWGVKFKQDDANGTSAEPHHKTHPFMAHLWQSIRCQ